MNREISKILGFLVSWILGFLGFVSEFQRLKVSKFQKFKVSKKQRFKKTFNVFLGGIDPILPNKSCFLEDLDHIIKILKIFKTDLLDLSVPVHFFKMTDLTKT